MAATLLKPLFATCIHQNPTESTVWRDELRRTIGSDQSTSPSFVAKLAISVA